MRLLGNVILRGEIEARTGIRIGTDEGSYEIGGMDNPVIRDVDGYPYIPGSSIKGKMRSMLEWAFAKVETSGKNRGEPCSCADDSCPICVVFGTSADKGSTGPSRLIVRDAFLTQESRDKLEELERRTGLPKVEVKEENTLNRVTSRANPRKMERVPAGTKFRFEMVFSLFDEKDLDHLKVVFQGLRLLEDSYLGGGGTRGSGQVRFYLDGIPIIRRVEDYEKGKLEELEGEPIPISEFDIDEFMAKVRSSVAQ